MSIGVYVILFIISFFSFIILYSVVKSVIIGNYLETFDGIIGSSGIVGSNMPLGNIFVTDTDKINGMSDIIINAKKNDDILHIYDSNYQTQEMQIDSSKSILDNLKNIINFMQNQEIEYSTFNLPLGFYKSPYLNTDAYVQINADYNNKNNSNYDDETLILYNLSNILKYHNNTINNIKYILKGNM